MIIINVHAYTRDAIFVGFTGARNYQKGLLNLVLEGVMVM